MDAIDGKQARRVGMASALGEMFDHGCGACSTQKSSSDLYLPIDQTLSIPRYADETMGKCSLTGADEIARGGTGSSRPQPQPIVVDRRFASSFFVQLLRLNVSPRSFKVISALDAD